MERFKTIDDHSHVHKVKVKIVDGYMWLDIKGYMLHINYNPFTGEKADKIVNY